MVPTWRGIRRYVRRTWRAAAVPDSVTSAVTTPVSVDQDAELLTRLRRGDELAFRTLVERYSASMLRVRRREPTLAFALALLRAANLLLQ